MATTNKLAFSAALEFAPATDEQDSLPTFSVVAYTGEAVRINGWDAPVVVDVDGMQFAETLTANLDHDSTKRVGHVTASRKQDGQVLLDGVVSAVSAASEEVIASGKNNYPWKASIEADPLAVTEVAKGKTLKANGREYKGPLYYVSESLLSGFGFVTRGADKNAFATISATADPPKEQSMKPEVKAWVESTLKLDASSLNEEQIAAFEANYEGRTIQAKPRSAGDPFEEARQEATRRAEIERIGKMYCSRRDPSDIHFIDAMAKMVQHACDTKMSVQDFRIEAGESLFPMAHTVETRQRDTGLNDRVLEAAICQAGRLPSIEKHFSPQELDLAHKRFKGGIGLNQFILLCAEANGYRGDSASKVTIEAQRAAFKMPGYNRIQAGGFSTIDVANIVGAVANKFVMDGWNSVDRTCLEIAAIQPVSNFQTRTTVSLTDSLRYEQVGSDGEIKHGTLDELTYTVQADTYAKMLAITRKDMINDDLGALTAVPKKLGNGAIKILNHIFWTRFLALVGESFFAAGNSNINTAVADMTIGGLDATEAIFMNQTNPDGTPLGVMPKILLVPTALKNKALTLMGSMLNSAAVTTFAASTGNANPFEGRFKVLSSPYISNSSYTGYTSQAWWMLADPAELPVIAIAALNGRVEPTVESADADFNTLGIQMRGYSDVGVNEQEYRGGVHADGNAS